LIYPDAVSVLARLIHSVLTVQLLLVGLVAAPEVHAQMPTGSVSGRAVDAKTGAPLEKVLVTDRASARSTLSDAQGRFELRDLPAGDRHLVIDVVGYARLERDVSIVAGRTVDVEVTLSEGTGTYASSVTVRGDLFRAADPAVAAQQTLGAFRCCRAS
jgi:hypothetical protein